MLAGLCQIRSNGQFLLANSATGSFIELVILREDIYNNEKHKT